MKLNLGVLFIFMISKFNHAKEDDIEQEHIERFGSTSLKKYDGIILTNTSNMSSGHFRIRSRRQLRGGACRGCGLANIQREIRVAIIKGDDVHPPYKYPWTVAIKTEGKISCTGSIINEFFILAAAHCFKRDLHKYEALRPTGRKVPYLRPSEVRIEILKRAGPPVRRIIPHSRFTISQWRNDIALLQLRSRISCNRFTSPICLPPPNSAFPRQAVMTITGFGSDLGQAEAINHLKEAKVRVVGHDECRFPHHLKDRNYYCVKGASHRKQQTLCYGDSGGPMLYRRGNKFYQFGVASFGRKCEIGEPFLYTSVPMHLNWIYRNMNGGVGGKRASDDAAGEQNYGGIGGKRASDDAAGEQNYGGVGGKRTSDEAAGEQDYEEAGDYGEGVDYGGAGDYEESIDYEGAGVYEASAGADTAAAGKAGLETVGSGMAASGNNDGKISKNTLSKIYRPNKCKSNTWSEYFPDGFDGGYS